MSRIHAAPVGANDGVDLVVDEGSNGGPWPSVEVPESGSESDIGKPDVSLGYYRVHSYRLKFEFLVSCAMKALLAAGLNEIPRFIDHSDASIPPSWKA